MLLEIVNIFDKSLSMTTWKELLCIGIMPIILVNIFYNWTIRLFLHPLNRERQMLIELYSILLGIGLLLSGVLLISWPLLKYYFLS